MKRIAAHTLGCKVNQYDTQAMLELFQREGYQAVPMEEEAEAYLINTCTVTGVGDKKSLQLIRRIRREHPSSRLIVCGCMAQYRGEELLSLGADLVIGTRRRGEVVSLLQQVTETGQPLCAVSPLGEAEPFEPLTVSAQEERTRAVLKIQEGCDNRCTYCIIPSVRGPIRSRPLNDIREEVERLSESGFPEIVLTGIHLCSYGRDLGGQISLLDVIQTVQSVPGVLRIRLGSLEPTVATQCFAAALKSSDKLCPQFHLALQSGSASVLARMRRRYNPDQFRQAVKILRDAFPHAAFTTDVMTGFPGETEAEFRETADLIREIGFSRIHVFPYSPRPNTPAASFPGQLPRALKEERARELIVLGNQVARDYLETWRGLESTLLPERQEEGCWEGYTPEYIRVRLNPEASCVQGRPVRIRLTEPAPQGMNGIVMEASNSF